MPAVLFDIDGTLADTNYLHVLAWWRAFREAGEDVAAARIHRMIGAGSGVLLRELIGDERDDVKDGWRRHYDRLKPEVSAIPGAADLLREVSRRGAAVVLATSSPEEDLDRLLEVLGADGAIAATTSAGDVDEAKPEPDLLDVALDKVGVAAADAIMVGDSVWDVEAAKRAGLRCIGVLTGGFSAAELEEAGAVAVYDDVRQLHQRLDASTIGALLGR
jgi:HAD superfamily hydrolase (TIGR01509 family)